MLAFYGTLHCPLRRVYGTSTASCAYMASQAAGGHLHTKAIAACLIFGSSVSTLQYTMASIINLSGSSPGILSDSNTMYQVDLKKVITVPKQLLYVSS